MAISKVRPGDSKDDRYYVRLYNPLGGHYKKLVRGKRAAAQHEAEMKAKLGHGGIAGASDRSKTVRQYLEEIALAGFDRDVERLTGVVDQHAPRPRQAVRRRTTPRRTPRPLPSGVPRTSHRLQPHPRILAGAQPAPRQPELQHDRDSGRSL